MILFVLATFFTLSTSQSERSCNIQRRTFKVGDVIELGKLPIVFKFEDAQEHNINANLKEILSQEFIAENYADAEVTLCTTNALTYAFDHHSKSTLGEYLKILDKEIPTGNGEEVNRAEYKVLSRDFPSLPHISVAMICILIATSLASPFYCLYTLLHSPSFAYLSLYHLSSVSIWI